MTNFINFFQQDLILLDIEAKDKNDLLLQISGYLNEKGYVKDSFARALVERERIYPTGLQMDGYCIAIPHTDSEHVNKSAISFVKLKNPVLFNAMGENNLEIRVSMLSVFALKEKESIRSLLNVLIQLFQDKDIMGRVLKAGSVSDIYTLLDDGVKKYAKD